MSSRAEMQRRIGLIVMLFENTKKALLSDIAGKLYPRFFDFDDEALDKRLGELLDMEEIDADDMVEIAALYFIMYLKAELEETQE